MASHAHPPDHSRPDGKLPRRAVKLRFKHCQDLHLSTEEPYRDGSPMAGSGDPWSVLLNRQASEKPSCVTRDAVTPERALARLNARSEPVRWALWSRSRACRRLAPADLEQA